MIVEVKSPWIRTSFSTPEFGLPVLACWIKNSENPYYVVSLIDRNRGWTLVSTGWKTPDSPDCWMYIPSPMKGGDIQMSHHTHCYASGPDPDSITQVRLFAFHTKEERQSWLEEDLRRRSIVYDDAKDAFGIGEIEKLRKSPHPHSR